MLEPLNADLWLLSPACQPYTVLNPKAKGAADPRARSFLHLMEDVLPALAERGAAPARLLVENVAGFEVGRKACALSLFAQSLFFLSFLDDLSERSR